MSDRCVRLLLHACMARSSGRRRAFRGTDIAALRDDGRNRRPCVDALCLERRSGRASVRCSGPGERQSLIHDRVRRLLRLRRLLLRGAERRGDDPVDLRREVGRYGFARRPCGADVQVSADQNGYDEHEDPSEHVATRGEIGLVAGISSRFVQLAAPIRPIGLPGHDRRPQAVRTGPTRVDESHNRRAPSSAMTVSVSRPAPAAR